MEENQFSVRSLHKKASLFVISRLRGGFVLSREESLKQIFMYSIILAGLHVMVVPSRQQPRVKSAYFGTLVRNS